jgi:hypothetical protein
LEIKTDEIDRRLIRGEETHVTSCSGHCRRKCIRRDGRAVCRGRRYAGAGEHRHPRRLRLAGHHECLPSASHARYDDAIEPIDGHAGTDGRTRLIVGRRASARDIFGALPIGGFVVESQPSLAVPQAARAHRWVSMLTRPQASSS